MSRSLEQLQHSFPEGEGFEFEGRKIFDPSWEKPSAEFPTDEMVVTYSDVPEIDE